MEKTGKTSHLRLQRRWQMYVWPSAAALTVAIGGAVAILATGGGPTPAAGSSPQTGPADRRPGQLEGSRSCE